MALIRRKVYYEMASHHTPKGSQTLLERYVQYHVGDECHGIERFGTSRVGTMADSKSTQTTRFHFQFSRLMDIRMGHSSADQQGIHLVVGADFGILDSLHGLQIRLLDSIFNTHDG